MDVEKLGGKTMTAKISVIMGSTSDWETMKEACQILEEFGVSYEKKSRFCSSHTRFDV